MAAYFSYFVILVAALGATDWATSRSDATFAQASASAVGGSMRILMTSAADYAAANQTFSGQIPPEALALPPWFRAQAGISTHAHAGHAFVVARLRGRQEDLQALLPLKDSAVPLTMGFVRARQVVTPNGGVLAYALPATVPDGAIVYVR